MPRSPSATVSSRRRSASAPGPTAASTCSSQAILDPGDEVVCGWPSFPSYLIYARKQGAIPVLVPLRDQRYDLDALLAAITPRTKLVYICHPNNPTGTMNTAEELDAYFERVPEHVLTVLDQAYFEYIDRPDYPDAVERYLKAGRRVVVLRTFSKIYGLAGLRVGYAVGPHDICSGLAKVRRAVRPDDARAGRRAREHRRRRRGRASAGGQHDWSCTARGDGSQACLPPGSIRRQLCSSRPAPMRTSLFERLLHEGVIVRPLAGFGSATAIRVSVGTPDEIDMFAGALERVLSTA